MVSLLLYLLSRRCSESVATELICACWFLSRYALLSFLLIGGDLWCEPTPLLLLFL